MRFAALLRRIDPAAAASGDRPYQKKKTRTGKPSGLNPATPEGELVTRSVRGKTAFQVGQHEEDAEQ